MIKLPKMVQIGPSVFRVETRKDLHLAGRITCNPTMLIEIIEITNGNDDQFQAETLMHEIQHGIFDTVGESHMNLNEGMVERVSNAWLNTLLSSPGLLDYLKKLQEKTRQIDG